MIDAKQAVIIATDFMKSIASFQEHTLAVHQVRRSLPDQSWSIIVEVVSTSVPPTKDGMKKISVHRETGEVLFVIDQEMSSGGFYYA